MDYLTPIANDIMAIAAVIVVPVAGMLANRMINIANAKFHLQISQDEQAQIVQAVSSGAGVIKAKLATGEINLSNVKIGDPHMDQAANFAFDTLTAAAKAGGVNRDSVAKMILAEVGHALQTDPSVPTIADAPPPPPVVVASTTTVTSDPLSMLNNGTTASVTVTTP